MIFFQLFAEPRFHTPFSHYNSKSITYFEENPLKTTININIALSEEESNYTICTGGNAKYPDLISDSTRQLFILNKRTKDLLLQFSLTPHIFLPLQFFYKKELKNYWWLIFDRDFILRNRSMTEPLGIEFNGSSFHTNERNSRIIDSKTDFYQIKDTFERWAEIFRNAQSDEEEKSSDAIKPPHCYMRPAKLLINSDIWQYDCFALPLDISPYQSYFVNEKLKIAIEKAKIRGLRIEPASWLVAV